MDFYRDNFKPACLIGPYRQHALQQGRQFVLKSGGDKRSDEKTLQQDGKNIE